MRPTDLATQRLHSQHLLKPDFRAPADVVRWFGAVQAQDFPGSLYGIGLRVARANERFIEEAVQAGSILRTWPMRGTIHFVPPEDALWMIKLLAGRQNVRAQNQYRKSGLTPAIFRRAAGVLEKSLRDGAQLTRGEIYRSLDAAGIPTTGTDRGFYILAYWAQAGLICLGPRRGKQQTIVLLEEWAPKPRTLSGDEALAELASRYFISHGPATIQDFAWWTGLTMGEARTGLQAVQSKIPAQTIDGRTYWGGPTSKLPQVPGPNVYLLPPYDEFTVAYTDRSAFVDPAVARKAGYGIGPTIIIDGRMAGTWKRTRAADSVTIEFDLLEQLGRKQHAALIRAAQRYADFVDLRADIAAQGRA